MIGELYMNQELQTLSDIKTHRKKDEKEINTKKGTEET